MHILLKKYLSVFIIFVFVSSLHSEQTKNSLSTDFKKSVVSKDSTNTFLEMMTNHSDNLMENHPAEDLYNNVWTSERINPYKTPVDSLHDSIRIDLSNFCIPVPGIVTSEFGPRRYRFHYGIDLRLNVGDSVRSAFSGKVRIIEYEQSGYGHYIVIRHGNGLETVYAHLSQVLVKLNQTVKAGELIAYGGNTGHSTGPHLHFETRYIGNAINPATIINFNTGKVFASNYLITKKQTFYYQSHVKIMQMAKHVKVKKGDNLGSIAIQNGTSVKNLCNLNHINTKTLIRPGQSIRVR
ncbi:MAG: M23 family metallopeptidase [Paludibacter sp.]|nr:M23 family metallopeptidase [Paludibacter sp.]